MANDTGFGLAAYATLTRIAGKTSSLSKEPGCVGGFLRLFVIVDLFFTTLRKGHQWSCSELTRRASPSSKSTVMHGDTLKSPRLLA
jgi:hypothetical protein